jgi:hypothetical protein
LSGHDAGWLAAVGAKFDICKQLVFETWANLPDEGRPSFMAKVKLVFSFWPVAVLSPPRSKRRRLFDAQAHRRWLNETWGGRVFTAEEVREMREAELGDRS